MKIFPNFDENFLQILMKIFDQKSRSFLQISLTLHIFSQKLLFISH